MSNEIKDEIKSYYDFWFGISAFYEKWAKSHGLTSNALFALYTIHEYPNQCTQRLICEKLLFPKQTVNTILETFEKKGYIRKKVADEDKRNKYILLTDEGRQYADEILSHLFHFEEHALLKMDSNERTTMIKNSHAFLKQLLQALEVDSE